MGRIRTGSDGLRCYLGNTTEALGAAVLHHAIDVLTAIGWSLVILLAFTAEFVPSLVQR